MSRTRMVIIAAVLFVVALIGWAVFLSGQGLENADKWVTVVGFFVTTVFAVVSLAVAWPASRPSDPAPQAAATDQVADSSTATADAGSALAGGRADHGGIANNGIINGGVRSEFHVHHHHRPRVSRRLVLGTAAGVGLGAAVTVAWRYGPDLGRWNKPNPSWMGRQLSPPGATVWSVALGMRRGEPLAVVGRQDGSIQLWNPVTGEDIGAFSGHDGPVFGLAMLGGTAVSTSTDGTVRVWDLTSDPPRGTPMGEGITGGVTGVALATIRGRTVAVTACHDRTVRIWDPANPRLKGRTLGSKVAAAVKSIALGSVDGRTIAVTGSADGAITLWDVEGERLVGKLGKHDGEVWGLAVGTVGGKPIAVSGGEDGMMRRWDLDAAQPSGEILMELPKAIKTVAISTVAGRTVAVSGCDDSGVRIWDLAAVQPHGPGLTGPEEAPEAVAISDFAGRPTIVSGNYDGTIWAWTL
ncbi:hypothetical protein [Actinoplanes sp. NPDC026670]|uniref:WD40 repeat domain-containing protein n=1 Tax=Actinoplanes sp. NPDC026670 TaxID=3154700 RepID=UPI0033DB95AF